MHLQHQKEQKSTKNQGPIPPEATQNIREVETGVEKKKNDDNIRVVETGVGECQGGEDDEVIPSDTDG